jgi:ubiquinone/menaquinone biosynthesis C-methylase UbiE
MLERARQNHGALSISNVTFLRAAAEDLPFRSQSFHAVISNGVFNLIPDKRRALSEVFRVLTEGGRLMLADQLLTGPLPENRDARVASWAR